MREILFRGKTVKGKWVEGTPLFITNEYSKNEFVLIVPLKTEFGCGELENFFEVLPQTVGQFTGLTDKNGKKIFEGDIVKCCHRWTNHNFGAVDEETFYNQKIKNAYGKEKKVTNGLYDNFYYYRNYCVEYFPTNGRYRVRNGSQFHDIKYSFILNHDIEVIGNIHDNPELLEVQND